MSRAVEPGPSGLPAARSATIRFACRRLHRHRPPGGTSLSALPGFTYQDLHREDRLADLDAAFLAGLAAEEPALQARLAAYRADPASLDALGRSRLLVDAARPLGAFVARLFGIEEEWRRAGRRPPARRPSSSGSGAISCCGAPSRRSCRRTSPRSIPRLSGPVRAAIERDLHPDLPWDDGPGARDLADGGRASRPRGRLHRGPPAEEDARGARRRPRTRRAASRAAPPRRGPATPRARSEADEDLLLFVQELLEQYAFWCHLRREHPALRAGGRAAGSPSSCPRRSTTRTSSRPTDPTRRCPKSASAPRRSHRRREGFKLTDPRMTRARGARRDALLPALPRPGEGLLLEGLLRRQNLGLAEEPARASPLKGCPLDEKISEMHQLRREGDAIGALALVAIDNPMCPGTGHRICNDCMKGCIFQKQEPVNIPQIETGVLTDVLASALGRRDLRAADALESAQPAPPGRAAVHGQEGPRRRPRPGGLHAGPLPPQRRLRRRRDRRAEDRAAPARPDRRPTAAASARSATGRRSPSPLDERPLAGFGGVSEYGITVRWDKNFLTLDPPDARAPPPLRDPRRRALRRHAVGRAGLRRRVRPRRASRPGPAGRRSSR